MLYTPKYILVAELDKKVCECSECKKFRVLYNHSQMTESKNEDICDSTSDIIAVCSKCSRMYRFDMRYIKNGSDQKRTVSNIREISETNSQVREHIKRNYGSYEALFTIRSEDFITKIVEEKEVENGKYNTSIWKNKFEFVYVDLE